MGSVITCGFYTEDYRRWLIPLVASLDRQGQPHDFVLAEKAGTMWETNTMAKAAHILAAKVVVLKTSKGTRRLSRAVWTIAPIEAEARTPEYVPALLKELAARDRGSG
jgi:hypothetical protein